MRTELGVEVDQTNSQDELYQKVAQEYGEALARMVCAYEADPELRRELSQEIHLALWRSLAKFNGRCCFEPGFTAWRTTWRHRTSSAKPGAEVSGTFLTLEEAEARAGSEDVERSADRAQALSRLFALIQQLDLLDRQVIMAYLEGLDAESIAEITGLSAANVWSKIHRIKTMLVRRFHRGVRNAE